MTGLTTENIEAMKQYLQQEGYENITINSNTRRADLADQLGETTYDIDQQEAILTKYEELYLAQFGEEEKITVQDYNDIVSGSFQLLDGVGEFNDNWKIIGDPTRHDITTYPRALTDKVAEGLNIDPYFLPQIIHDFVYVETPVTEGITITPAPTENPLAPAPPAVDPAILPGEPVPAPTPPTPPANPEPEPEPAPRETPPAPQPAPGLPAPITPEEVGLNPPQPGQPGVPIPQRNARQRLGDFYDTHKSAIKGAVVGAALVGGPVALGYLADQADIINFGEEDGDGETRVEYVDVEPTDIKVGDMTFGNVSELVEYAEGLQGDLTNIEIGEKVYEDLPALIAHTEGLETDILKLKTDIGEYDLTAIDVGDATYTLDTLVTHARDLDAETTNIDVNGTVYPGLASLKENMTGLQDLQNSLINIKVGDMTYEGLGELIENTSRLLNLEKSLINIDVNGTVYKNLTELKEGTQNLQDSIVNIRVAGVTYDTLEDVTDRLSEVEAQIINITVGDSTHKTLPDLIGYTETLEDQYSTLSGIRDNLVEFSNALNADFNFTNESYDTIEASLISSMRIAFKENQTYQNMITELTNITNRTARKEIVSRYVNITVETIESAMEISENAAHFLKQFELASIDGIADQSTPTLINYLNTIEGSENFWSFSISLDQTTEQGKNFTSNLSTLFTGDYEVIGEEIGDGIGTNRTLRHVKTVDNQSYLAIFETKGGKESLITTLALNGNDFNTVELEKIYENFFSSQDQ